MNRRVATAWQLMVCGAVVLSLAAPAAGQKLVGTGRVIQDGALVRAGGGSSFYVVGKLKLGTIVQIDDKIFDWYKIVPPPGIYSYIRSRHVDLAPDRRTGTVNTDRAAVRAADIDGPGGSYRTQLHLFKGDTVTLATGVSEGAYYKIVPPKGAYVCVRISMVKRLEPGAVDTPDPADTAVAVDTSPAPPASQPAMTTITPQPQPAPAQPEPKVIVGAKPPTDETKPPPTAPQPPVPSGPMSFQALEERFAEAQAMPLEQQPLEALLGAYAAVQRSAELTAAQQRIARLRIYKLKSNAQLATTLRQLAAARKRLQPAPPPAPPEAAPEGEQVTYDAVGQLFASSVYDGVSLPRLYRLVSSTWHTIAYLRPAAAIAPAETMGAIVGVAGQWRYDPALKLRVLEATRIEVLKARATDKTTAAEAPPR